MNSKAFNTGRKTFISRWRFMKPFILIEHLKNTELENLHALL